MDEGRPSWGNLPAHAEHCRVKDDSPYNIKEQRSGTNRIGIAIPHIKWENFNIHLLSLEVKIDKDHYH